MNLRYELKRLKQVLNLALILLDGRFRRLVGKPPGFLKLLAVFK
jgi:hypothetical protein